MGIFLWLWRRVFGVCQGDFACCAMVGLRSEMGFEPFATFLPARVGCGLPFVRVCEASAGGVWDAGKIFMKDFRASGGSIFAKKNAGFLLVLPGILPGKPRLQSRVRVALAKSGPPPVESRRPMR